MSHTRGPWSLQAAGNYACEITGLSPKGKIWPIARITAANTGRNVADANARLIAAAPDLLEALEKLVMCLDEGVTGSAGSPIELAKAAILKAKAEAP